MTAINDLSHKEWMDLVYHPNTKRADGNYAYRCCAFLDENPHPFGSDNYYLWKEGWEQGLAQDNTGRLRFSRLVTAIRRREVNGWFPEQEANGYATR